MSWLADLGRVYLSVFRGGAELLARNWILVPVAFGYQLLLSGVAIVLLPLGVAGGMAGGFLAGMVTVIVGAACTSSWLALVEQIIRNRRIVVGEVRASFFLYLSDLLNVGFLLMVLQMVGGLVFQGFLEVVFFLALLAFLNAIPEQLYLGHHGGVALFTESYTFIGRYWIEWFPATVLLSAIAAALLFAIPLDPMGLVSAAVMALAGSYALLVRGLLFQALTSSSRRAREFRRRAGT